MKFPLEMMGEFADLKNAPNVDCAPHCGRVYLFEFDGYVKVGSSKFLMSRARTHKQHLTHYGIKPGRAAYSITLDHVAIVEQLFHASIRALRRDSATEVYTASIEELVGRFDIEYKESGACIPPGNKLRKKACLLDHSLDPALVLAALPSCGGSAGAVASRLRVGASTVRGVLVRLEAAGKVNRTGSCKGTRWGIVDFDLPTCH